MLLADLERESKAVGKRPAAAKPMQPAKSATDELDDIINSLDDEGVLSAVRFSPST